MFFDKDADIENLGNLKKLLNFFVTLALSQYTIFSAPCVPATTTGTAKQGG